MMVKMATLTSMLIQVMFTKKKTEPGIKSGTSKDLKVLKVKMDKLEPKDRKVLKVLKVKQVLQVKMVKTA